MNLHRITVSRKRFAVCCPPSGAAFKTLDLDDGDQLAAHVDGWGGIRILHRARTRAEAAAWLEGLAEIHRAEYRQAATA